MARPSNDPDRTLEQEPEQTPRQDNRRVSYAAGDPGSAPELVRFMNCQNGQDLDALDQATLLRAALQGKNTIADWEVAIVSHLDRIDEL